MIAKLREAGGNKCSPYSIHGGALYDYNHHHAPLVATCHQTQGVQDHPDDSPFMIPS